jgi:hypothetical protein
MHLGSAFMREVTIPDLIGALSPLWVAQASAISDVLSVQQIDFNLGILAGRVHSSSVIEQAANIFAGG